MKIENALGFSSTSKAVLFPVVMRSPVVPFPSCPFSALPKAKTSKRRRYQLSQNSRNASKELPLPASVSTRENVIPAEACTTCSLEPLYMTFTPLKAETSGLNEWPHYRALSRNSRCTH